MSTMKRLAEMARPIGDGVDRKPEWVTLDVAFRRNLMREDIEYIEYGIGPRRVGLLYQSGYWGDVNTILGVHVKFENVRDLADRVVRKITHWSVTERNGGDVQPRTHCTPWVYDPRNKILHGPTDLR